MFQPAPMGVAEDAADLGRDVTMARSVRGIGGVTTPYSIPGLCTRTDGARTVE